MNTSYCRMQNTSNDLSDRLDNWETVNSAEEQRARLRIWELAKEIVEMGKPEIEGEK